MSVYKFDSTSNYLFLAATVCCLRDVEWRLSVCLLSLPESAAGTKKSVFYRCPSARMGVFNHWLEGVKYPEGVSFGSLEFMLLKQEGFRKC